MVSPVKAVAGRRPD